MNTKLVERFFNDFSKYVFECVETGNPNTLSLLMKDGQAIRIDIYREGDRGALKKLNAIVQKSLKSPQKVIKL